MSKRKTSENGHNPKGDELLDSLSRAKNAVLQFKAMSHYHEQTGRLIQFNLEDAERAVKELNELEERELKNQTSIFDDNNQPQVS